MSAVTRRLALAVLVSGFPFLVSFAAYGCGDKLTALGGGVQFERLFLSRHPGRIVMLLEPASALRAADEKYRFSSSLSLAGHQVKSVSNAVELRDAVSSAGADLVLVDVATARHLQFQSTAAGQGPAILPVLFAPSAADLATAEKQVGCVADAASHRGRQLLKIIEKTLQLRSRGLSMPCAAGAAGHKA